MPRKADRYNTSTPALDVYLHDAHTGALGEHEADVWFQYHYDRATSEQQHMDVRERAISVRMPVRDTTYGHHDTLIFFDNLLLESDTRGEIALRHQIDRSDIAGLLGRVGAECAGAVALWHTGTAVPKAEQYREYSDEEITDLFDERHGERLTTAQLDSRQVMSGVQRKLVFRKWNNRWQLPLDGAPGTWIVKRSSGRFDGLVANELACLLFYAALELSVPRAHAIHSPASVPRQSAQNEAQREPTLLAIERYDRVEQRSPPASTMPTVQRLHQEDMCQVLGRLPKRKYQRDGGPSLRDLATALRLYSAQPATDIQQLLRATIANVCLGNTDAHAKNFSLLYVNGSIRLAPFYDLVCTEVYPTLSTQFSMRVGHAWDGASLDANDTKCLAKDFGVSVSLVHTTISETTQAILDHCREIMHQTTEAVGMVTPVLDRMEQFIMARCRAVKDLVVG